MYTTEIVDVGGVPTKVKTWGNTLTDVPRENSNYIIFIPGTPGLIDFYVEFLEEIHKKTNQTVWSIGHAGHDDLKSHKMPSPEGNEYLFNLEGQINHKITFIENYLPRDVKITLVGHSLGTYIILKILKVKTINERVLKSYLLFPTIENVAETKNGQFFLNRIHRFWFLILPFIRFFQIVPTFSQDLMLRFFFWGRYSVSNYYFHVFKYLVNPYILQNWHSIGVDALQRIKERDDEVLKRNIDNIKMYYGAVDRWVPVSYYEDLKKDIPNIDAELCSKGFNHSFMFEHSISVAEMVAKWMKQNDYQSNI